MSAIGTRKVIVRRHWNKLVSADLGHICGESAPHDLLVCILSSDNPAELYERLRREA
jgi:hypothetical protein